MADKTSLPLSEVHRMRTLIKKVDEKNQQLTASEEAELRRYLSIDEPEIANSADLDELIKVGKIICGIYIYLSELKKERIKREESR